MSTKEKILHTMTRSDTLRKMYGILRQIPGMGTRVQRIMHAVMPRGTKLWIRIPDGVGKGKAEEWNPVHPHYSDYRQLYLWAVAKPRVDGSLI